MASRSATFGLSWELEAAGSTAREHAWVLTAMQRHGPALVRMLWRILGNEEDVCDAYQAAFVRLARLDKASRPRNVKAFVFRTASNTAISMLRKRKAWQKVHQDLAGQPLARSAPVGGELDAHELREALRREVARLPEVYRQVVVLRDLAEMPYTEVARILGITKGTARVYRCRALRLLAGRMARREDDE